MRDELAKKFYDRWPEWFDRKNPPVKGGFWGFECGDGWFNLLWELCEGIEKLEKLADFQFLQVKEKFAGLRAYNTHDGIKEVAALLRKAEDKAEVTCENCGQEGKMRGGSWLKTLCDKCDLERRKK